MINIWTLWTQRHRAKALRFTFYSSYNIDRSARYLPITIHCFYPTVLQSHLNITLHYTSLHTSKRLQQDIYPNGFTKTYIQTASTRRTSKRLQQDIHPNGFQQDIHPNGFTRNDFQQEIHPYSSQQILRAR